VAYETLAAEPARKMMALQDGAVSYLEWKTGADLPPLHFAHANGFNGQTYRTLLGPLASRFHIRAWDARGHGMSELPVDIDTHKDWYVYRDDLIAFLERFAEETGQPVLLAGHSMGALVAQVMYGNEPAFRIPEVALGSLMNLPWIVVIGLVIGLMAGLFIHISRSQRLQTLPLWLRLGVVGVGTGVLAWWFPEIQGIGYDSVAAALNNQLAINVLLALMVAKLLITAITVAGGVPIGIIGPVLVAGAATGALGGMLGGWLWPEKAADPGIYAMLGMAAMMGAVLQAPLAALMALLELTHTPNIMLPGMLVVVVACLTSRQLTGCEGFFISSVRYGLHPLQQPLMQALSRVSVPAVMERRLVRTERMITPDQARRLLETNPMWLVIERSSDDKPVLALKAAELARWLLEHDEALNGEAPPEDELVDLLEIPGQRLEMAPIGLQATLSEAFLKLQDSALGALYVVHGYRPKQQRISGIITRGAIERYYHYTDARQPDVRDTYP